MKTSNLFGLLALGGIGYYLLKNNEDELISSVPPPITYVPPTNIETKLVENPYVDSTSTSSTSTNSTSTSPMISNTETALAPLGLEAKSINERLELYLKNLPKLTLSNASSQKVFDLYPPDGVWKNAPDKINSPLWDRLGIEYGMEYNGNSYISLGTKFLVRNPQARNKYTMYVDQFGNIIDAGRGVNGMATVSAKSIAEYRNKYNIPF
jgi:hypothetical protein